MSAENIKNCKYTAPRSCLHLPAMPNALLPCILPFPNHALDHSHLFCSPHPFRSQGYREPVVAARKPRMHRSRHAADVAPTGSSFGLRTSTRVPGANLGSDTGSVAVTKRSVFGPPSNHRADPGRFLKKTGARSSRTSQRTFAAASSACYIWRWCVRVLFACRMRRARPPFSIVALRTFKLAPSR